MTGAATEASKAGISVAPVASAHRPQSSRTELSSLPLGELSVEASPLWQMTKTVSPAATPSSAACKPAKNVCKTTSQQASTINARRRELLRLIGWTNITLAVDSNLASKEPTLPRILSDQLSQCRIDPVLPTRPRLLEVIQNVPIDAQRHKFFGIRN